MTRESLSTMKDQHSQKKKGEREMIKPVLYKLSMTKEQDFFPSFTPSPNLLGIFY